MLEEGYNKLHRMSEQMKALGMALGPFLQGNVC